MGAFDGLNLNHFKLGGVVGWDEDGYQCEAYVEPEVGNQYRMWYGRMRPVVVTVLAIFNELIVVQHRDGFEDAAGYTRYEEACVRRNASFLLLPDEVATATDANTSVE